MRRSARDACLAAALLILPCAILPAVGQTVLVPAAGIVSKNRFEASAHGAAAIALKLASR